MKPPFFDVTSDHARGVPTKRNSASNRIYEFIRPCKLQSIFRAVENGKKLVASDDLNRLAWISRIGAHVICQRPPCAACPLEPGTEDQYPSHEKAAKSPERKRCAQVLHRIKVISRRIDCNACREFLGQHEATTRYPMANPLTLM